MRFLIDTPVEAGMAVEVGADRAHYLCKVMRHQVGDILPCFNGQGTAFEAQLTNASSRRCELNIIHDSIRTEPASTNLELGLAILKGQAMDRALHQATELGASAIHLLQCARSNVHLDNKRMQNKLAHWRKIIVSACEQSGQLHVPVLHPPSPLQQTIEESSNEVNVLDMAGELLPHSLDRVARLILVGPEGGWDEAERALFSRLELTSYQVSKSTLRAETTPAVALALFAHISGP